MAVGFAKRRFGLQQFSADQTFDHDLGFRRDPEINRPRRSLLNKPAYNYRGVEMLDLIETSRGCRFKCYPCQVP